MTLSDMKTKIFALIEEASETQGQYTDDPDFALKINDIINQIQMELVRIKKLPSYTSEEVDADDEYVLDEEIEDFYQLNKITGVDYNREENVVFWKESGTAKIFYYKYPTEITSETQDSTELELPIDILNVIPYGVAADILKSDVSNNYGQIYAQRYQELKQGLDPRYAIASIRIDGGISI